MSRPSHLTFGLLLAGTLLATDSVTALAQTPSPRPAPATLRDGELRPPTVLAADGRLRKLAALAMM